MQGKALDVLQGPVIEVNENGDLVKTDPLHYDDRYEQGSDSIIVEGVGDFQKRGGILGLVIIGGVALLIGSMFGGD